MLMFKTVLAAALAAGAALAISATAFAAAAGPLTIRLTCDTGPSGSGTFVVTANSRSSTVTVRCNSSATVTNPAWLAGSVATIHQTTATAFGQLRALDVRVTLTTAMQTVSIRNFRAATATATSAPRLAQTGGGLPVLPIGGVFVGVLLIAVGSRFAVRRV